MTDSVRRILTGRVLAASKRRQPIERAISVLDAVAETHDGLKLSELAHRIGVPKTSTGRVLGDLQASGMVVRDRGRYLPGPRMLAMAAHVAWPSPAMLVRLMLPYVVNLYDETGLSATFAAMRYGNVYFESLVYGHEYSTVLTPLARWAPAHCTSTGKVLLAYGDQPEPAKRAPALTRYTAATITSPEALAAELEKVRRIGLAINNSEYVNGLTGFAVPVFAHQLRLVGTLAVCGRPEDVDQRSVTSALRRIARAASSAARALD